MSLSSGAIVGIVIGSVVVFLILLYIFIRWYTWRKANRIDPDMPRVFVNPKEYSGKWYEIAANPAWFESGCVSTTATYTPQKDYMEVLNRCYRNGRWDDAHGRAYKTDHDGVFAVEFFPGVYGNYTVTYRDTDTSIVTNTDRTSLWILSRHPTVSSTKMTRLLKWLKDHDFDTSKLVHTTHLVHD